MKTQLNPKKTRLIGRMIVQLILLVYLGYSIYKLAIIKDDGQGHQTQYSMSIVFCLILNIVIFLQLQFLPFWIIIDNDLKELEIKYLFLKSKKLRLKDISSFSDTTIKWGKSGSDPGIFLNLSKREKILISDINIDNYAPLVNFFYDNTIPNIGYEEFSYISYYLGL